MDGSEHPIWPGRMAEYDNDKDRVMLQANGLSLFRSDGGRRSIELEISSGENWIVFGPVGSGRTRLFDFLTALTLPASGQVRLLGKEVLDWRPRDLRRLVAWIHSENPFLASTVREELSALGKLYGKRTQESEALELVEQLAPWLLERLGKHPASLEPDERLAVDAVRRVHAGAALILLDELPLDAPLQRVQALYRRICEYCEMFGLTSIMASADPFTLETPTTKGAFLWGGEVRASGVLASLRSRARPFELVRYLTDLGQREYRL